MDNNGKIQLDILIRAKTISGIIARDMDESNEKLAEAFGVSIEQVNKWFKLKDLLPLDKVIEFSEKLDISLDFLIKGDIENLRCSEEFKKTLNEIRGHNFNDLK